MSKRLMLALMLVFASAAAHAQSTATPHGEGTAQGSNDADADTVSTPKRTPHPAASTETRKGQRSDAARNQQRWHSFLPGMFR